MSKKKNSSTLSMQFILMNFKKLLADEVSSVLIGSLTPPNTFQKRVEYSARENRAGQYKMTKPREIIAAPAPSNMQVRPDQYEVRVNDAENPVSMAIKT